MAALLVLTGWLAALLPERVAGWLAGWLAADQTFQLFFFSGRNFFWGA